MRRRAIVSIVSVLLFAGACVSGPLIIGKEKEKDGITFSEIRIKKIYHSHGRRRGNVSLTFLVRRDEGDIIGVRTDRCKIESLVADNGIDMVKDAAGNAMGEEGAYEMGVETTGKLAVVQFAIGSLPPLKTKELRAVGEIVLIVGTKKAVSPERKLSLESGEKAKAGMTALTVSSSHVDEEKKTTTVYLSVKDRPKRIIDISFRDDAGNEIEKKLVGIPQTLEDKDGGKVGMIKYRLKGIFESVRIKVTYWAATEEVSMPFKLRIGLSLDRKRGPAKVQ